MWNGTIKASRYGLPIVPELSVFAMSLCGLGVALLVGVILIGAWLGERETRYPGP
jgi:hypothetical protein